ncbi:ATP-binding protein [Sphingomonas sp. 3P27F8]|uniref:ATP-binding protein n=1 Tax=Sphingomonas sp. 3P27F8 TaxID=2502213 RepID=UPI0010F64CAB|nr:ATP-binding protein [Sphingomonas sp. 3P27F8]
MQQAIAAVSVSRRGDRSVLDLALRRLTGAADLQEMLAGIQPPLSDLGELLTDTCNAALRAAGATSAIQLHINAPSLLTNSRAARPILMIAAELVTNSVRHAFPDKRGNIVVVMADDGHEARLTVEDNGTCLGWRREGGQGANIVDDLARAMGGGVRRIVNKSGSSRVVVSLPTVAAAAIEPAGAA